MKLFFALAAQHGIHVGFSDTTNAFQQLPPPVKPCFIAVDDAYCAWYEKRFGIKLDPQKHVFPLQCALQGHPEAGASFERLITALLVGKLGFKSTTHERNLYSGEIDGVRVLA